MTKEMPREIYAWMGHQDNGSWDKEPCPCCPSVKYFRADAQSAENADCIEWLNEIRCWIKRCKDTDWGEDDEAICETIRAALTEAPKVDVDALKKEICDSDEPMALSWCDCVDHLTTHYDIVKKEK